ncbi:Sec-independent protein translocase subunit TatA [Corynebacterium cystitidis]|uniref:Sec-independent protein translocase protein TatA n=1 Tax=Corynebacterium cystitidis DSM 20524 TaxID=1121357 RepID=A0A1H9PQA0_9CORY|nr:Sec-independent protein translocase subunit TatA [Corynebacterium cystitidis]WJY82419.1 Sec-independent protein translocase protein TatAd [Corynebacterium cystitidis DSM 20524]SER50328.1 sec-independent protein translocase protein TatA [Corynebacterium cystitidis DSM 20524]SNV75799.1 Sec-independent protein translocase [Corynebacterium cystitidis]
MPNVGWVEFILILVVILLLFGAKKLPDLARSMGRSARIFKSEVKEMQDDNEQPQQQSQLTQAQQEQDFWDRPENQPTAHPEQLPQQQNPQNQ